MGVKKNFAYNSFLTVSNYLINLILFPFCTRVLGAERYGTIGFTQNIVQYFTFIAMMGITTIGVREIARQNADADRSRCFSSMFVLNLLYTLLSLCIFVPLIFLVPRFAIEKELFLLGALNILFSTFCIEWFFKGIENFRYITIRSIIVKVLYVIAVFVFVRSSDDYVLFYLLSVVCVFCNALINYLYSRKFVKFSLKDIRIRPYVKASLFLGAYSLLTSMYTTFNVLYLGFVRDDTQVGYYTAAIKLYTVILGFYSAFTAVMLPQMSSLLSEGNDASFKGLIDKSMNLLYTITLPFIALLLVLSPEVVTLLAGSEYVPSIQMSRIVIPMLFVVGVAQVIAFQILIPKGYDKVTLTASVIGAVIGVTSNVVLVKRFGAIGTCWTVVITEVCVTLFYVLSAKSRQLLAIDWRALLLQLACSLPYVLIALLAQRLSSSIVVTLAIAALLSVPYFLFSQTRIIHNELVLGLMKKFTRKI